MSRYAAIDTETTGLSPAHHHRIVEIAVVLVDDDGNVVYEWETLLNPPRDVGATEIYGLSAGHVYSAPTFGQVASELGSLLRGRVPVAHNLSFDGPFVASEFERLGYVVPLTPTYGLCTMRLASRYLVAADTDSISGKARKARDLGVPIVDYATYVDMLAGLSR